MSQTLKVLCIHGVGNQDAKNDWQQRWLAHITDGLRAWNPGVALETNFLRYDDRFTQAKYDIGDAIGGTAGLVGSAIYYGLSDVFGSVFGRRGIGDSRLDPLSRGRLDDSLRWTVGMVQQWANDSRLREALRRDLLKSVNDFKPDVIVAHSLGSLIAYDTFVRNQDVLSSRVLITLGCQIANPGVRKTFGGRIVPLTRAAHWYNLYNTRDIVLAKSIQLSAPNFTQVDTVFDIPGDITDHAAEWYLKHNATGMSVWRPLATAIGRARTVSSGLVQELPQIRSVVRQKRPRVKKRALLVGINDYKSPLDSLEGCVNDCFRMSEILQELGFEPENIRLVLNDRATSSTVLDRLDWLLEDSEDGDARVFYYSGHGAQLPGYSPGETVDHKDECLCTYDFDWTRENCITDNQFFELYSQLPYGTNFVTILDCCHSGGMTRDGGPRVRGLSPPDDIRHRTMKWNEKRQMWIDRELNLSKRVLTTTKEDTVSYLGQRGDTRKLGSAVSLWTQPREFERQCKELNHHGPYTPVIIQACKEDEYSYEYRHGVTSFGAFTYSASTILRELKAKKKNPTITELVKLATIRLAEIGYRQTPQIVGPKVKLSQPFLPAQKSEGRTRKRTQGASTRKRSGGSHDA